MKFQNFQFLLMLTSYVTVGHRLKKTNTQYWYVIIFNRGPSWLYFSQQKPESWVLRPGY